MPPFLLLALLLAPQDKPPERCSVSGTVVDSVTEKPVGKVEVALRPADRSGNHTAVTRTDAEGRFTLVDLDPGSYQLSGERPGYLDTNYRGIVRLDAGQKLDALKLKIVRHAVLSGRVVDPGGEPVGAAHLVLAARTLRNGRFRIEGNDSTDADEDGVFRFAGLSAGKYYVLAQRPPAGWDKVDHSPTSATPREALIATFYPSAPDLASAAPIELRPGERRDGVELRMLRNRVFRLAGRVVNPPTPRPSLTLRPIAIGPVGGNSPRTTTRNAAGDFEFRDVAPGAYWLTVGGSVQRVDIGFADLEGVSIRNGAAAELRIAVTVEGQQKPPSLAVGLLVTDEGRSGSVLETGEDGTATRFIAAGLYEVDVFRAAKGFYVKSIRSGEREVLVDGLEALPSGSVRLDVVLAGDPGRVEGSIGEAVAGATVVLIPETRGRIDRYQTAITDQYGRFTFAEVPPGTYKAFAWEDVKEGDWFDADVLKRYESQAVELKLDPRATKSLDLKIARDK